MLNFLSAYLEKKVKKKYEDVVYFLSQVALDVFVGAAVFYLIHFVFSAPLIWIGAVFVLSVAMRSEPLRTKGK